MENGKEIIQAIFSFNDILKYDCVLRNKVYKSIGLKIKYPQIFYIFPHTILAIFIARFAKIFRPS